MIRQKLYEREENFDQDDRIKIHSKTGGKCAHCGTEVYIGAPGIIKEENLFTIDHFIPLNKGGSNRMVNLIPLCLPCNEEKGQLIVRPQDYIKHMENDYKNEIIGLYESYIASFDYLSRNNLLACDEYEYTLPAILNTRQYHQMNNKRFKKAYEQRGKTFKIHRAGMDDLDMIIAAYVKYLKKYGGYESDQVAKAHILYWLVNGCIYYITSDEGIQAFTAITPFKDHFRDKTGKPTWVYALRMFPVFYYVNTKNKMMLNALSHNIVNTIIKENDLPYACVEIALLRSDNIDKGGIFKYSEIAFDGDERYKFYRNRIFSRKRDIKTDPFTGNVTGDNRAAIEKEVSDYFEKIEEGKEKLKTFVKEDIYPPFGGGEYQKSVMDMREINGKQGVS